jgi:hypothetical protein
MNTLGDFQSAAIDRLYDGIAVELGRTNATGAAYLYGYAIECSLKAGFFRVCPGVVMTDLWDAAKQNLRTYAALQDPKWAGSWGFHDLHLLLDAYMAVRVQAGVPLSAAAAADLRRVVLKAVQIWSVDLRYTAAPLPSPEVLAMRECAELVVSLV